MTILKRWYDSRVAKCNSKPCFKLSFTLPTGLRATLPQKVRRAASLPSPIRTSPVSCLGWSVSLPSPTPVLLLVARTAPPWRSCTAPPCIQVELVHSLVQALESLHQAHQSSDSRVLAASRDQEKHAVAGQSTLRVTLRRRQGNPRNECRYVCCLHLNWDLCCSLS